MPKKKSNKAAAKRAVRNAHKAVKKMSAGQKVALFFGIVILIVAGVLIYFYVVKPILDKNKNGGFLPNAPAEGDLMVHFIDVGQGDCILIQLPDGKCMLIDGGDNKSESEQHIVSYLNDVVKIDKIEYLVLTHTDSDHVGGLDVVLDEFIVENIYRPEISTAQITTNVYAKFIEKVEAEVKAGAKDIVIKDDSDIDGGNYTLDFFAMESLYETVNANSSAEMKNGVSPLIFLTYASKKVLFTGDANEKYTEPSFLQRQLNFAYFDIDVLKVGHHGSESSSSDEFLKVIKPEYAVFQCGDGNKHLHPRQAALDRIIGYTTDERIYRSDTNGDIVLTVTDTGVIKFNMAKESTADTNKKGADTAAQDAKANLGGLYISIRRITIIKGENINCNLVA